jgi:chromosome segregation ATPase
VANLIDEARKLAREEGRRVSETMLERVASTLHAAAADEEARFRLAQGRLPEELEPPGFELLAGLAPPAAPRRGAKRKRGGKDRAERLRELAAARKELAAAQARTRRLRQAAAEAERALDAAREEAEDAEAAVEQAKQRVESLE